LTRSLKKLSSRRCESGKKSSEAGFEAGAADSLEAFLKRLRDRCADHGGCHGADRDRCIEEQAQRALDLADELGLLKQPDFTFGDFRQMEPDLWSGTEHVVELSQPGMRYHKTTIPPAFGLIPKMIRVPVVDLRADPSQSKDRKAIEFVRATPLEYLERWQASNEIFSDDVRLTSVIAWPDGAVSFGITQPQYHGIPAEPRDIERCFLAAGWTRMKDPSGHVVYFNYVRRHGDRCLAPELLPYRRPTPAFRRNPLSAG
jgi:hypothetical protein